MASASRAVRFRWAQRLVPFPVIRVKSLDTIEFKLPQPPIRTSRFNPICLPSIRGDTARFPKSHISDDICRIETQIVENLLSELLLKVKIFGHLFEPLKAPKYFGHLYREERTSRRGEERTVPKLPNVSEYQGFRQSFVERRPGGRVDVKRGMSIWERILPLLQPPLHLT